MAAEDYFDMYDPDELDRGREYEAEMRSSYMDKGYPSRSLVGPSPFSAEGKKPMIDHMHNQIAECAPNYNDQFKAKMSEPKAKPDKSPGTPMFPPPVSTALITSLTLAAFAPAFHAAQAEMTNAARSTNNPFFKSKYATLETVQAAVMPPLSANGISVIQGVGPYGSITTRLLHVSGEWMECTTSAPMMSNVMNVVQAVGVTTAYLRRYSLLAMCGIAQVDDDGNGYAAEGPVKREAEPEPAPVLSLADALAAVAAGTDGTAVGLAITPTVQFLKVAGEGKEAALIAAFRAKFPK